METKELSQVISTAPEMTSFSNLKVMALVGAALQNVPSKFLQQFVFALRSSGNAIDLDADRIPGIFNFSACGGTKPSPYGVAFQVGNGSDWYQFAVDSNSHFYVRANVNNKVGEWRRLTRDTSWTAPVSVGGGNTLSFSNLRGFSAGRRAA